METQVPEVRYYIKKIMNKVVAPGEKNIPLHVVAVLAVIQKGDKFLIARRSEDDPQAGGEWSVPGGKVDLELGLDIIENSLKREVMEEVGIDIEDDPVFLGSEGFIRVSGHHVVGLIYLTKWKSGEAKPLEDQAEIRWVTLEELKLMDNLPVYMKQRVSQIESYLKQK